MAHPGLSFVSSAVIYIAGQIANLLFQLLLLQQLGQALYAEVGLAHLLLISTLFIADLGYSTLFLRDPPDKPGWSTRWRQALLHRLFLTVLLNVMVLLGWSLTHAPGSDGFSYLISALPATLFGLINYSAPLLAQGRRHAGFLLQQVAWPAALMISLTLVFKPTPFTASTAGALVSLGYAIQATVNLIVFGNPLLLLPKTSSRNRRMLESALRLSLMGIVGTLHDRLTPFLVAQLAPGFTASYLILNHVLNGASGMFNQFNRLLLVEVNASGARWAGYLSTLLLTVLASCLMLIQIALMLWPDTPILQTLPLVFPILLGWVSITVGGLASALAIGRRRERQLLGILVVGLFASAALQFTAYLLDSAPWLLWARAMTMLGITLSTLLLCRLRPALSSWLLILSALVSMQVFHQPVTWLLSIVLLAIAILLVCRQANALVEIQPPPTQMQSPAEFQQALLNHYGTEVSRLRHELFFINQRASYTRNMRCFLAALRDAVYCLSLPKHTPELPAIVAVVSLPGSSGRDALEACLQGLESKKHPFAIVTHPRLRTKVSGLVPACPSITGWLRALQTWIEPLPSTHQAPITRWPVRCTLFRHRLWLEAWRSTLAHSIERTTLLVHNDFDMFSVAAIEAGRGTSRSLCVQHGLPTDEFAPPRAERQLVWGRSSRAAYLALHFPAANLLSGPSKALAVPTVSASTPSPLCIVSQTHTPIFGRSLSGDFTQLANNLYAEERYRHRLRILLHPEECRRPLAYPTTLIHLCCRPPHAVLHPGAAPCIILGFCSTALLDAARCGHLVIGLDWQAPGSKAARRVGQPLLRVHDNQELIALIDELDKDPSRRHLLMLRQQHWLEETFTPSDEWLEWLEDKR